jgi:hypothetical protein
MDGFPSIEQQVDQLMLHGWKRSGIPNVWKSPLGKLHLGPHGAWKAMTGTGDAGRNSEVTVRTVSERP